MKVVVSLLFSMFLLSCVVAQATSTTETRFFIESEESGNTILDGDGDDGFDVFEWLVIIVLIVLIFYLLMKRKGKKKDAMTAVSVRKSNRRKKKK